MMPRFASLLLLPALVLAGCGRAESGELGQDSPRPAPAEAPATPPAAAAGSEATHGEAATAPLGGGSTSAAASMAAATPAPAAERAAASPADGASAATPPSAGGADEILRRVEQAYSGIRALEADFVQHLTVPLLGTSQRSEGKMYQKRPDRFAMRFTDPAGDVIVADGRYFWMYNPSADPNQVIRARMGDGRTQVDLQQEFLSNPSERYVATRVGTEAVGGRPAHVLTLVPKGPSNYRIIRVWVDQQDYLVRRFEMTEENESVRRIELRNLRRNPDLADTLFQFTPPPGVQIFDQ